MVEPLDSRFRGNDSALMTGRKLWNNLTGYLAFWTANIGMVGMTGALAVAGISQVYLERKLGLDFLVVQKEIQVHFVGMLLAASLFATGIILYIINFIRFGLPKDEAMIPEDSGDDVAALNTRLQTA